MNRTINPLSSRKVYLWYHCWHLLRWTSIPKSWSRPVVSCTDRILLAALVSAQPSSPILLQTSRSSCDTTRSCSPWSLSCLSFGLHSHGAVTRTLCTTVGQPLVAAILVVPWLLVSRVSYHLGLPSCLSSSRSIAHSCWTCPWLLVVSMPAVG